MHFNCVMDEAFNRLFQYWFTVFIDPETQDNTFQQLHILCTLSADEVHAVTRIGIKPACNPI